MHKHYNNVGAGGDDGAVGVGTADETGWKGRKREGRGCSSIRVVVVLLWRPMGVLALPLTTRTLPAYVHLSKRFLIVWKAG